MMADISYTFQLEKKDIPWKKLFTVFSVHSRRGGKSCLFYATESYYSYLHKIFLVILSAKLCPRYVANQ